LVAFEERGRKLFAAPASASRPGDVDLLVAYSFLLLLEGNLRLFREFAANEIGRLQGISGEVKKPDPTGTGIQQPPA
jgi:hypothetical protein